MVERPSATLRRKELGRRLRELRTAKSIQVQEAAAYLQCSPAKVSRVESGARATSVRDVRRLCELYEVPTSYVTRLEELVRDSKQKSWWQSFDVDYATYIGLEQSASAISEYQPFVVPGLLQTRDYATALIEALVPKLDSDGLTERVNARIERQAVLERDDPPELHLFLDEIAFGRTVGGPRIMSEQIRRVDSISQAPKVHLQIIPSEAGPYPGFPYSFALLEFPHEEISPVAYLEQQSGDLYLERREDVERYRALLNDLRSVGLPPKESRNRLHKIAQRFST